MLQESISAPAYLTNGAGLHAATPAATVALVILTVVLFLAFAIRNALNATPRLRFLDETSEMKDLAILRIRETESAIRSYAFRYRSSFGTLIVLSLIHVVCVPLLTSAPLRALLDEHFLTPVGYVVVMVGTLKESFQLVETKRRSYAKKNFLVHALRYVQELMAQAASAPPEERDRIYHRVVRYLTRALSECEEEKSGEVPSNPPARP